MDSFRELLAEALRALEEGRSLDEAGLRQRFEEEADRPLKGDDLAAKALHKGHQALLAWAAGEAERAWREGLLGFGATPSPPPVGGEDGGA